MENEEFSSDTSDDDYVPGAESDVEEASGAEDEEQEAESEPEEDSTSKKRGKRKKKGRKKPEVSEALNKRETEDQEEELTKEEKKEKEDNLWASFKKDVDSTTEKPKAVAKPAETATEIKVVTKEFEFAGEKVKVTEEVKVTASSSSALSAKRPPPGPLGARKSGLSGLANILGAKKQKLSTLEKSKLDWESFKQEEGIGEDLKTFNQGKQGFLERQAFLERADHKQFEIERNLRLGRKTNR